jgi:voltage-gated potassium channel
MPEVPPSDARYRRWQSRFEIPVMLAALATLPVLIVEQNHPAQPWRALTSAANWAIWLVFAVELGVMMAVAPSPRRWLRDSPMSIVIVLLTPPFLSVAIPQVRLLRVLRLLRLVRLAPMARRMFSLEGLRYASALALLALIGGAEAFAAAENTSVGNGLYWALTTMTTVGYGDITPKTTTGKVVACVLMLIGIGFFAMITGAIAQRFLAVETVEVEREVAAVEHELREVESIETHVLSEMRDIAERMRALEARVVDWLGERGG